MAAFAEDQVIYRYKYLPFSLGALETLVSGTMKFTCGLEFNDPFDCNPHFDLSHINEIHKFRPDLYRAAGDMRGLSPAKRIAQRPEFIARLRNSILDGTFRRQQLERVGLVSLSREATNVLMWSHYAENHKGFVLEFRIPVLGEKRDLQYTTDRLLPFPVIYQPGRPSIKVGVELPQDLVNKIVLTKCNEWEYEAEERVVDHLRPPGIYPYSRNEVLCSVIAGMRMEKPEHLELVRIVSAVAESGLTGLKLYTAAQSATEYKIFVPGHPRLHGK